jgi:hypothetical protein
VTAAVTAVVPTRNRRAILADTLESILAQRDVEIRVIVVDEASSDDTPAFLADLTAADVRVTCVPHDPPQGVALARNAGLARVDTPWVAFCDDDDLWAPDKVVSQLAAIAATPGARWSCCGAILFEGDREIIGHHVPPASGDIGRLMRIHNVVPAGGSGLLVETALARDVGGYDAWFTGCEDYEMGVKLALRSTVASVDGPLVAYRVWPSTMSTDVRKMQTGHQRVLERWQGDLDPAEHAAALVAMDEYLAWCELRGGTRLGSLRRQLRIACRRREPRRLMSALLAASAPSLVLQRQQRGAAERVPQAWREDLIGWFGDEVPA